MQFRKEAIRSNIDVLHGMIDKCEPTLVLGSYWLRDELLLDTFVNARYIHSLSWLTSTSQHKYHTHPKSLF